MKNTLVIALRELEEKRFVMYAALAFAVMPFILAAIPWTSKGSHFADVLAGVALILGTGFTIGLATITGGSFIGRDLSDGRMSFYFSRPVSSMSIWFGKLAASFVLIAGSFALIVGPARLATGDEWTKFFTITLGEASMYALGGALALFLIAHVLGTFARSHSAVIVFDFAAAVACGVALRFLLLPLIAGGGFLLLKWLSIALAVALVVAIIGGGAWQLERGRTDRRRNHLALSQFLWGTMAVALLLAAGYVSWVVSVKLSDLTVDSRASRSSGGPFAVVSGGTRGRADYRAGFLLNAEGGAATRIDPRSVWGARYSRDGRSVVLPRREGGFAHLMLYRSGSKEPIDTGLTVMADDYVLSDDGGRLATISQPATLSVYDIGQKRSLASVRLPDLRSIRFLFVTPDVVRLYLNVAEGVKIVEVDVRNRGMRETGLVRSSTFLLVSTDPSAARMLVRAARTDVVTLNDASTGTVISTLLSGTSVKGTRFLRDGRIAIVDGPKTATVLHILSPQGAPLRSIPLGPSSWSGIVGDDGRRIVVCSADSPIGGSLIVADMNRGVIERRQPVREWFSSGMFDLRPPIQPLREVFYGDGNGIVAWNPATGAKRRIT